MPPTSITLALTESSLELIPEELWSHPSVKRNAKRRGKKPGDMLLDLSLHFAAARRLQGWERRGRPDIVHTTLLYTLSTPLCKKGMLRIYIHTVAGLVIEVKHDTRIPRNYNRFVGLMEQLLKEGQVPREGEALMKVVGKGFNVILEAVKPSLIILLTDRADLVRPRKLAELLISELSPLLIVGGFQRGDFSPYFYEIADLKASIYPEPLNAWVAASIVLHSIEEALDLY
ncbi:MAG: 16S rRNA methyltransferase [Candidatus Nezhaarchaeota archaeon]|nr:16S rRNA methyltransferase [Candidatus Nezhaarchaeota archaeon]